MGRTAKQAIHDKAMRTAIAALYAAGHQIERQKETHSPFDLLVDNRVRCEVKAAKTLQDHPSGPRWRFNLHRHGKLKPNQADVYWLYLLSVPGHKYGLSLIIPHTEIEGLTNLAISVRSLITHWSKWYMRMDLFDLKQ